MQDGTIFSHTRTWRGKPTTTEYKWDSGKWWKQDRKGVWKACVGTETNRVNAAYLAGSQLTLIPAHEGVKTEIPEHLQKYFQKFEDAYQEMKASQLAAKEPETDALAELDVNNETVLRPEYIHPDILGILGSPLPTYRIFARPEIRGDRHYAFSHPFFEAHNPRRWTVPQFLPGVTSIIKKTCSTPHQLIEWMATYPGGITAARAYTNYRADLGTAMHSIFAMVVNKSCPDLESPEFHALIDRKLVAGGHDPKKCHREWHWFLCKAIASFLKWIRDCNVTFILMEIALVSQRLGYAGQIDVVCEMDLKEKGNWGEKYVSGKNKGKPKKTWKVTRVRAIVDFKSGAYSYDSHHVQLGFYVPLLREAFPKFDMKGMRAFNWHPNDWMENPKNGKEEKFSYTLIDQTGKLKQMRTDCLLALYDIDSRDNLGDILHFAGVPEIGQNPSELVSKKPFAQHWEETFHLAIDLGLDLASAA